LRSLPGAAPRAESCTTPALTKSCDEPRPILSGRHRNGVEHPGLREPVNELILQTDAQRHHSGQ